MKLPPSSMKRSRICCGLLDAGAPAQVFAEGHRAEAERADAQAGAAEGHVVIERHGALVFLEVVRFMWLFILNEPRILNDLASGCLVMDVRKIWSLN